MKVKAIKGFVGMVNGQPVPWPEGQVGEMPAGADWIKAGLVEAVDPEQPKAAPRPKGKK